MLIKYVIECYNPVAKKYEKYYESYSYELADKMMFKPYYRSWTRRLVRISTDVLYTEKK